MTKNDKIQKVVAEEQRCRYCAARSSCTGGSMLIPGGPTLPECANDNYKNLFIEALYDQEHPQPIDK